jgi:hypothetical protein
MPGVSCRIEKKTRPGFTYVSETIPCPGEKNHDAALSLICIGPGSAGVLLQWSFLLLADLFHVALDFPVDGKQGRSVPGSDPQEPVCWLCRSYE